MNLQPLYDLKERLEYAAIAGTGLLGEDFRLKRAVESLAPLADASPVFGKIRSAAQALLDAPVEERAPRLLDVLSLVSAVAYTQGTAGVSGELTPMEAGAGKYIQASHGQLHPLITALDSTGSGRMSIIRGYWEEHPDYFSDYRVLPHVISALGDSYAELSDLIYTILCSHGDGVVPLLKRGFDPRGKREMVRRVQVIEALAGAGANDFYLSQLEKAEKDVRTALIYALHHEESNAEKLVELCQTERSAGKKSAHWALAKLESPAAWAYWDVLAAKEPIQAAEYMTLSTASKASALVADALGTCLASYESDPSAPLELKEMDRIQTLLLALPGKAGPEICQIYRRMAALGTALDNKSYQGSNKQTMAVRFKPTPQTMDRNAIPFSKVVPNVLRRSILFHPAPDLLALAEELGGRGNTYAAAAITAALLAKNSEESFAAAEPYLKTSGLLQKKRAATSTAILLEALQDLHWNETEQELAYHPAFTDPAAGGISIARPIHQSLDRRWHKYLAAPGGDDGSDLLLARITYPTDTQLCMVLGKYFYQRALIVQDNLRYMDWMRRCGWTDCRGLLEAHCKRNKVNTWDFIAICSKLPGTPEAVTEEAERVLALIQTKKIAVGAWNPTHIEKWIAERRGERLKSY